MTSSPTAHRKLSKSARKQQRQQHLNQSQSTEKTLFGKILTGMHVISQHRLEVLFKRTPYADTFRYIRNFKTRQVRFQDIFYNFHHILYSYTCCERVFYIRDFNNEHIALFCLPIFPPQATPKLSKILYTEIVYSVNLDAILAS